MKPLTQPLTTYFDIEYFHFHHVTNDGKMRFLCNNPSFCEFFYSLRECKYNPYMVSPSHIVEGFGYWELVNAPYTEETVEFLRNKMGIQKLLSYIWLAEDGYYVCGYGIPNSSKSGYFLCGNQRVLIEEFSHYFLAEASEILPDIQQDAVNLCDFMKGNFHQPLFSLKDQYSFSTKGFLNKINKPIPKLPNFTRREKECLNLLGLGLTAREVGERLQLSRRTVENYIANIKDKLGIQKRSEIVKHLHQINKFGIS